MALVVTKRKAVTYPGNTSVENKLNITSGLLFVDLNLAHLKFHMIIQMFSYLSVIPGLSRSSVHDLHRQG
jgi:hypothetical protein